MFGRHRVKHRVGTEAGLKPFVALALAIAVACAGCASTRSTSIAQLLRQPITLEQHEVMATRYREQATEARTLAASHAALARNWQATLGRERRDDRKF